MFLKEDEKPGKRDTLQYMRMRAKENSGKLKENTEIRKGIV